MEQQIALLTMKKERLDKLIGFARGIQLEGVKTMDFSVFDTQKIDEYAKLAKEEWGKRQSLLLKLSGFIVGNDEICGGVDLRRGEDDVDVS